MNTNVFRNLSYGVYVVSSLDGERLTGCIANSVMQITSSPETVIVSLNHNNFTNECIEKTGKFAVSILSEKSDASLIGNFGFRSGRDNNKFENVNYIIKESMPIVQDSCGFIVCNVINKMETETHTIFLGKVIDCDVNSKDEPMTYAYYHKVVKGSANNKESKNTSTKYVCSVCGYIYEGEELPEDYICPVCKQGRDKFNKL